MPKIMPNAAGKGKLRHGIVSREGKRIRGEEKSWPTNRSSVGSQGGVGIEI